MSPRRLRRRLQLSPDTVGLELQDSVRKFGLPPLADDTTEILVIGTMPSDLSLSKRQYYAHPSNDFWRLMGSVLNEEFGRLSYDDRVAALKRHRIGLWDIYHNCVHHGSLDCEINVPVLNDFTILRGIAPRLRLLCFNGKKAAKSEDKLDHLGYKTCVLPSSTGSKRKNSSERVRVWKCAIEKSSEWSAPHPLSQS